MHLIALICFFFTMKIYKTALLLFLLSVLLTSAQATEYDSLSQVLSKAKGIKRAQTLNLLASKLIDENPKKGLAIAMQALTESHESKFREEEAKALYYIGLAEYNLGNKSVSLRNYQLSLQIADKYQFEKLYGKIYNSIASYYYYEGNYTKALNYYKKALASAIKDKSYLGIINYNNNIANTYQELRDNELAIKCYLKSLQISDSIGYQIGVADAYLNMGNLYSRLNQNNKSLDYYNKSLQVYKAKQDKFGISTALLNIAISLEKQGKLDLALQNNIASQKIAEQISDKVGISMALNNIGNIYQKKKDHKKALDYLNRSLAMKKAIHYNQDLPQTLMNLSTIYFDFKQYDKCLKLLKEAEEIANKLNDIEYLASIYKSYSELYSVSGNYKSAYKAYQKCTTLKDTLEKRNDLKKITEIQYKYDVNQKQKEIELLKKDNAIQQLKLDKEKYYRDLFFHLTAAFIIISGLILWRYRSKLKDNRLLAEKNKLIEKQAEALRINNEAKNKFFSIVAHDLKSPFSGLLGFSEMLVEDYDQLADREKKEYLVIIKNSTEHIFELIENLLQWSRLQAGRIEYRPEKINLKNFFAELSNLYEGNLLNKNLNLITKVPIELDAYADKNMIRSVIQNLLANAIKFTPTQGSISITAIKSVNMAEICIADSGIGMSEEDIGKLFRIDVQFTRRGTNNEEGTGLGLILCQEQIERNGGELWVKSEEGKGSRFYFTLPIA